MFGRNRNSEKTLYSKGTFAKEFEANYRKENQEEAKSSYSFDLKLSTVAKLKNLSHIQIKRLESQIELWTDII